MHEVRTEHIMPGAIAESELSQAPYPLPDRDTLTDVERAAFDAVVERGKRFFYSLPPNQGKEYRITAYYRLLLQSPLVAEMWAAATDLFQTAASRGTFSNRARDLVQVALIPVLKEQLDKPPPHPVVPLAYAIESGIAPKDIKAIWDGRLDELTADDRLLVEYVQATVRGILDPRRFEGLVAFMGIKAAVEYTSFISYKVALFRNMQAIQGVLGIDLPESIAQEFIQSHIDGKIAPGGYGGGASWVARD